MRILGRVIIVALLCSVLVQASVKFYVDDTTVTLGDTITATLEITGKGVKKPDISSLCGEIVSATGSRSNMTIVNGQVSSSVAYTYTFEPKKDCTIAPISIDVNGQIEKTLPINIKVKKQQANSDDEFILELSSSAKEVYVGEPFTLVLTFKERIGSGAIDSQFESPNFSDFWVKEEKRTQRKEENGYYVTRLIYVVAAQKSGMQKVDAAKIKIAFRSHSRDAWGQWFASVKWRNYFSNDIDINVKPLPSGVILTGDFTIEASVDKQNIKANEAANLTLVIKGSGNFEDIDVEALKPDIPGVSIFADKSHTQSMIKQGQYQGVWSEKFALIGERDFVIPPFEITFFDIKSKQIKTIKTDPIPITVESSGTLPVQEEVKIKRSGEASDVKQELKNTEQNALTLSLFTLLSAVLLGVVIGVLLAKLPWKKMMAYRKKKVFTFSADKKEALSTLVKHLDDDDEVRSMVDALDKELYDSKKGVVDDTMLRTLLKKYS